MLDRQARAEENAARQCKRCGGQMPADAMRSAVFCGIKCFRADRQKRKVARYRKMRAMEIKGRRCPICDGPIPHKKFRGAKFCSKKCEKSLDNPAQRLKVEYTCPHCKEPFHPIRETQVYCGHKCAGKAAALAGRNLPPPKGPPRDHGNCELCGVHFVKKERHTKYCSRACFNESYRLLTAERFDRLLGLAPPRIYRRKLTARGFDIVLKQMRPKRILRLRLTGKRFDRLFG